MSMLAETVDAVIGIDTHKRTHTAALVAAATGGVLALSTVSADPAGYAQLFELVADYPRRVWAIEGTGSYGCGVTRWLHARDERVVEIDHPSRSPRRNGAKDDSIDAIRAAREALGRSECSEPRATGQRAALAALLNVRRSAVDAAGDAQRQLRALLVTAPESVRERCANLTPARLLNTCVRLRSHASWDLETRTTVTVLRGLAQRIQGLHAEARQHERMIKTIVSEWRPDLLELHGVGAIIAATVLCAWSHPGRIRSEAAFAMLAGTAPIPASSGDQTRYRLNRHGDRQLNQALHTIVISRLRWDPATRTYAERRRAEGKTNREIRRCLKRYITRQLYKQLENTA